MKLMQWDNAKNEELKSEGRASFDELVQAIAEGQLVDDTPNKNYPQQRFMWVLLNSKIHLIAYEDRGDHLWLATAFPSSAATDQWMKKNKKE